MKEATENIVAEKPKTKKHKEGDSSVPVEGATATQKTKAPAVKTTSKFRILDGVEADKYRGQRNIVIKALQSLGEGFHSLDAIVAKSDGLVSKTPVEASVKYHLAGLKAAGAVEVEETSAPAAEAVAEAA